MSKQFLARFQRYLASLLLCAVVAIASAAIAATATAEEPAGKATGTKLAPKEERDPKRLWCKEHNIYEDECLKCHPELAKKKPAKKEAAPEARDPNRLWCKEHGKYEDECVECHPELANKKPAKKQATTEARDPDRLWCEEHGIYEDECVKCHPELAKKKPVKKTTAPEARDPNRLWCKEHDKYEDECVECHPELANKKMVKPQASNEEPDSGRLKCNEHGGYEDECVLCHPELANKAVTTGEDAKTPVAELKCKEHGVGEVECGICHPERVAVLKVGEAMKVRFASTESTAKAGVEFELPVTEPEGASRELLGQVTFDMNRLVFVSPLSGGVVTETLKEVGDSVEAGETLAMVQSPDLAEVRSEYQKALAEVELSGRTLAREKDLFNRQISARQDMEQAEAAVSVAQSTLAESRQHLLSLGLDEADLSAKNGGHNGSALLPVRAPIGGTIIERKALPGIASSPGEPLYQIADLSHMWMQLSVPEDLLGSVQTGAKIEAHFSAYPDVTFEGEISWISPSVDPSTHLLQARAVLPNPDGLLKDGLFGRAGLLGEPGHTVLTVPVGAVQDIDGKKLVFQKLEDDLYEARRIKIGATEGDRVIVLAGLAADERIVTGGSYIVKSELLKARLGAGCTDE